MKQSNSRNSAFQLTASQGGWQGRYRSIQTNMVFQLTASQGGWPTALYQMSGSGSFQLTASQGGWLVTREKSYVVEMISTHSLTRRLTAFDVRATQYVIISTHSLTRRLTWIWIWIRDISHFNSQPHKEADNKTREDCVAWDVFQLTASQGGWQVVRISQ